MRINAMTESGTSSFVSKIWITDLTTDNGSVDTALTTVSGSDVTVVTTTSGSVDNVLTTTSGPEATVLTTTSSPRDTVLTTTSSPGDTVLTTGSGLEVTTFTSAIGPEDAKLAGITNIKLQGGDTVCSREIAAAVAALDAGLEDYDDKSLNDLEFLSSTGHAPNITCIEINYDDIVKEPPKLEGTNLIPKYPNADNATNKFEESGKLTNNDRGILNNHTDYNKQYKKTNNEHTADVKTHVNGHALAGNGDVIYKDPGTIKRKTTTGRILNKRGCITLAIILFIIATFIAIGVLVWRILQTDGLPQGAEMLRGLPVNGSYSEWSKYGACSHSCGSSGATTRLRMCDSPAPQNGGRDCKGPSTQSELCQNSPKCPINGKYGEWGTYGRCTRTCGDGRKTRIRMCNNPEPQYGGSDCSSRGPADESLACPGYPCPIDGGFGEWSMFGLCSVTCAEGTTTRNRRCDNPSPQHGGKHCDGTSTEISACQNQPKCPINGGYNNWSSYSSCSVSCGEGTRTRTRMCNNPEPQYGGRECSLLGASVETGPCIDSIPCPIDGAYGEWSEYGPCFQTCDNGTMMRVRQCDSPAPQYGGSSCTGSSTQITVCPPLPICPIHGEYGEWSAYTACSATCGIDSSRTRVRTCNNPVPQYGGDDCQTPSKELSECPVLPWPPCPVDGGYGEWSAFSRCSATCHGGEMTRFRVCNSPFPQHGGKECEGPSGNNELCPGQSLCPVDGGYEEWGEWTSCSSTCLEGKRTKQRRCNTPEPLYGGKNCEGSSAEVSQCPTNPACNTDGSWGGWNAWGVCSLPCSAGSRTRRRFCDEPPPTGNGEICSGPATQYEVCNEEKCLECSMLCVDRPDGVYDHPNHDCTWYCECFGVQAWDRKCAPGTCFDTRQGECTSNCNPEYC